MNIWLSQTMTWLHTQVRALPASIESWVVCDKTANLNQFPVDNLVSADRDLAFWRFLSKRSWQVARRRQAWLLHNVIVRRRARILHSHFGDWGWANLRIAAGTGVKHVVSFYGYDASQLPFGSAEWRRRYAEMFDAADLFLCEGPHLGGVLRQLGCPAHKIRVHHLGVNIGRISHRPRKWQPGEPLRVLLAGSFIEKKGFPYALEALAQLRSRVHLEIDIVGDANGQDRSRQEKARIVTLVERFGLTPHTLLLGYRPHTELFEIAHRCHVFISPSITASDGDTEGGAPVSVIEMAATGMPVVSTSHCDIPEVLEDGVTGLLAAERDVEGLVMRLNWLVDHPDAWEPMASAARRKIEMEFNAVSQGTRLAEHYESLL
jgi:colanic acid/amylovoran biosynthesis glycosyltransferase